MLIVILTNEALARCHMLNFRLKGRRRYQSLLRMLPAEHHAAMQLAGLFKVPFKLDRL